MKQKIHPYHLSIVLLAVTMAGILYFAMRPTLVVADTRLHGMPMEIASLSGREMHFEDSVYAVLNADANLLRNYSVPGTREWINLYIGYYGTSKGGRASHLPQFCYTGQGWAIEDWTFTSMTAPGIGPVRINRMIVKKAAERQLVYFWFQSANTVMATGLEQNWYKFHHKFVYNRNDGAFVRVSLPLPDGNEAGTEEKARDFSQTIMPLVSEYWPIESPQSSVHQRKVPS